MKYITNFKATPHIPWQTEWYVKIEYDDINTDCPFTCPICNRPVLFKVCHCCGAKLNYKRKGKL